MPHTSGEISDHEPRDDAHAPAWPDVARRRGRARASPSAARHIELRRTTQCQGRRVLSGRVEPHADGPLRCHRTRATGWQLQCPRHGRETWIYGPTITRLPPG